LQLPQPGARLSHRGDGLSTPAHRVINLSCACASAPAWRCAGVGPAQRLRMT